MIRNKLLYRCKHLHLYISSVCFCEGMETQLDTKIKLKCTGAFFVLILFISLLSKMTNFTKNNIVSLFAGMFLVINYIEWIYYFVSAKKLHAIKVHTKYVNDRNSDFGRISIPYHIEFQPNDAVISVSALSALRGSNQHRIISSTSDVSSHCLLLALVVFGNLNNVDVWIAYLAAFGLYCVSCWELNNSCPLHVFFHNIGACLAGLVPLCFCLQTCWSISSIVLLSVCYVSFALQNVVWLVQSRLEKYTKETTHIISVCCITLELIGLIAAALCMCLYISNLSDDT